MTRPPWSPELALRWLREERASGRHDWKGLCAGAAAHAAGWGYAGANANQWAWSIPTRLRRRGTAPAGKLQFWEGGTYGHVAWTLGNGWLLCNKPDGSIGRMRVEYYAGISPTWWVDPLTHPGIVYAACGGHNENEPKPKPAPKPKPPANPVLARPGKRSPAVPAIRKLFGGRSGSTYYGSILKARVMKWQKIHHSGHVDGIVTKNQFAEIVRTKGR